MSDTSFRDQKVDDEANWRRFMGKLGEDFKATPVYKLKLNGPGLETLVHYPKDLRDPDNEQGKTKLDGLWQFGGEHIRVDSGYQPWDRAGPSRHFADRLHRFHWLRDVKANGRDGALRSRALLTGWSAEFGKWNNFVWRLSVTVDRVWNWLTSGEEVLGNHPSDSGVMDSIARQLRHIQVSAMTSDDPYVRLRGLSAMVLFALATDDTENRIVDYEVYLESELEKQILADGGHVSRSPERLLDTLLDLQTIADLYTRSGRTLRPALEKLMSRMGGMVGFLKLSDGGLPVFNGASEVKKADVATALKPYQTGKSFSFATKSGFQRLSANGLTLVLDAGGGPELQYGLRSHSGCLGFDLTDGDQRIVTSCGSSADISPPWRDAVRSTSAHSTLGLNRFEASPMSRSKDHGLMAPFGPSSVSARRLEEKNEIWIEAQHNGWRESVGLLYRRRLFMLGDGSRLTGEDVLARPISEMPDSSAKPEPYALRFHIHPSVRLFESDEHIGLLLSNGRKWLFKSSHGAKAIERTMYLGHGSIEKSWQLVLSAEADPNGDGTGPSNRIQWAFVRMSGT